MRRFFARNLLFMIGLNLLVKPFWIFMIDRTVQNKVGHASYGIYQALVNLGLVFQILLDFGINNYNSTALAQEPKQINKLFPAMLSARAVLGFVYMAIVLCIALALGYRGWQLALLMGILFTQFANAILQFIRSNVNGLHFFKADGLLSISDRLLMIFICGALLWMPATASNFKIEWFVWAQLLSYSLAVLVGIVVLKKLTEVKIRFSFNAKRVGQIMRKSLPYALLIFLMSIYTRVDMMLVERMCGAKGSEQAGVYAAAYRLLDVGNMFGLMFAGMLLPLFGRILSKGQTVAPIVQFSVNLLMPVSILVAVTSVSFNAPIMHMLYRNVSEQDTQVFTCLMLAFPAFSLSNIYSTLLTANGDLKTLNIIAFLGVFINIGLNIILIPKQQSLGAAISALVTQSVLSILFLIYASQKAQLAFRWKRVFMFLAYALALVVIAVLVQQLEISWLLQCGLLVAFGTVLLLLLRFVDVSKVGLLFSGESKD